jgi:hypothetical protein
VVVRVAVDWAEVLAIPERASFGICVPCLPLLPIEYGALYLQNLLVLHGMGGIEAIDTWNGVSTAYD